MPISRETFTVAHNLMTNKFPKGVGLEGFSEFLGSSKANPNVDLNTFGLFDVSSPDFSKYYPEVTPEDLKPSDADFVYPIYRALSEVVVNKYGPIDFSTPGVLKKSMKKLQGQAVFPNHDCNVGNELGVVIECAWQEEKTYEGVKVPAGFNARLKLDGKSNPKTIRGVMMDPPAVHSTSVGVTYKWEKSHPEMEDNDFWNKLGSYDKEGTLIRRVVTEIVAYHEISFVTHGADPYAQKINEEGGINNPKYAKGQSQFTEEDFKTMAHFMDFKEPDTIHFIGKTKLDAEITIPTESNKTHTWNFDNPLKTSTMNKEFLAFLVATFGLATDTTEEKLSEVLKAKLPTLLASETSLAKVQKELSDLKAKYPEGSVLMTTEDSTKLEALKKVEDKFKAIETATREEAVKFYTLTVGGADKADANMIKLINESPYESLTVLHSQYKKTVDESFVATCQDCNSTNVKRNSSLGTTPGVANNEGGSGTPAPVPSINDTISQLSKKAQGGNGTEQVHGASIKKPV